MAALAKKMVGKLLIFHLDDEVVAKVRSVVSSGGKRTRPPPLMKPIESQPGVDTIIDY